MNLIEQLKTIPDPRGKRGKRHALWLVLLIALLGSLCGYWGYRPLVKFCDQHRQTVLGYLELDPETVILPCFSTFRRIFQVVDAAVWVSVFNVWAIKHPVPQNGSLWSLDGKRIKCTVVGGNSVEQTFAMLVSVYGQPAGVVQLELMYNGETSEIEVARCLLQRVTRNSAWAQSEPLGFSLDALHVQVETLSLIESRDARYIVGLKANQPTLYHRAQQLRLEAAPLSQASQTETVRGRLTQRTVQVYAAPTDLPERWSPAGITRIVWIQRAGHRDGKPFVEEHFYLSNWNLEADTFLALIRTHWQIENGLHWVNDVTLKEDDPPRRGGFAPISWAVFHTFLITLARRAGWRTVPDCMRHLANQVHEVWQLLL